MTQQDFLTKRNQFLNGNVFQKNKATHELFNYVIELCRRLSTKIGLRAESSEMEDIHSETAQSVILNIHRFKDEYNHSSWIGKILKNKFLDLKRMKNRRGGYAVISIDNRNEDEDGNERMFDIQDEYHCFADRIHFNNLTEEINNTANECLKSTQLEIWKLKWEEDLSNTEIMSILKKDKNYVAVNWMRAKEQVTKALERKGCVEEILLLKKPGKMAA